MNRRRASKRETRQLILEAAKLLFRKKGVEACTMRRIAAQAGVSPASVVLHFKKKTALLETALFEDIDKAVGKAIHSMEESRGLYCCMMHIAHHMFSFYDTNRELYRILVKSTVFEPPEKRPNITRQLEEFLRFTAAIIEHEKEQGRVRRDADADVAAMGLFPSIFAWWWNFCETLTFLWRWQKKRFL